MTSEESKREISVADTAFRELSKEITNVPINKVLKELDEKLLKEIFTSAQKVSKAIGEMTKFRGWDAATYRKFAATVFSPEEIGVLVTCGLRVGSKWRKVFDKRNLLNTSLYQWLDGLKDNRAVSDVKPKNSLTITLPRMVVAFADVSVGTKAMMLLNGTWTGDLLTEASTIVFEKKGLPRAFQILGVSDVIPAALSEVYREFTFAAGRVINYNTDLSVEQRTRTETILKNNLSKFTCFKSEVFLKMWRDSWSKTGAWEVADFMSGVKNVADLGEVRV